MISDNKYTISTFFFLFFAFLICFVCFANQVLAATAPPCSNYKEECIEAGDTRYFDGVPVTLDCWKYLITYECKDRSDNNCEELRKQGCSEIGARCKTMINGVCIVQDETYGCQINQCNKSNSAPCGKDIFCTDGNCAPTNSITANEEDRGKALAYLSALNDAAKQVKDQNNENPIIFAGRPIECSRNILPGITKDCCADNEGIFSCAEDEKELFQMKKSGRAIEVGEYCHNKPLGLGCSSYHRVYCVFGSRMARIIQNDGRKNQLGIGFGDVGDDNSHPDCRGITKEELSRIDFRKINFSELFEELENEARKNMPRIDGLKQKTSSYTYEELKEKSSKVGIGFRAAERIKEFYETRTKK